MLEVTANLEAWAILKMPFPNQVVNDAEVQ